MARQPASSLLGVLSGAPPRDLSGPSTVHSIEVLGRFEWRGVPFAAWLFRIAANAIADRAKRAARERGTPAPEPVTVQERVEEQAQLYRLVRELPADQRRVVEMRFTEGKTIREISVGMGRSEGAVKQLQLRAVQSLRAQMGQANG